MSLKICNKRGEGKKEENFLSIKTVDFEEKVRAVIGINAVNLLLHFTPASFSHDFYDLSRSAVKIRSHRKISFSRSRDDCANDQEKESLDKLKFYYKKDSIEKKKKRRKSV